MALLFIGILLHKPHEEDEQDGSSSDADDDRDHHDSSSQVSAHRDVSVAHCDLSDHLIVETGYERIQFRVDFTKSSRNYLSTSMSTKGRKR